MVTIMPMKEISLEEIKKNYSYNKDLLELGKKNDIFILKGGSQKIKNISSLEVIFYACKETGVLR